MIAVQKLFFCKEKILLLLLVSTCMSTSAQQNFFVNTTGLANKNAGQQRVTIPNRYRTTQLNSTAFLQFLATIPKEENTNKNTGAFKIQLPMPGGDTALFSIWETSAMEPALAAKFPEIKTYSGQGITDPTATLKMDWTSFGFHAMVLSPVSGSIFIDPYALGNTADYISYFKKDLPKTAGYFELAPRQVKALAGRAQSPAYSLAAPCRGTQLFQYRLAIACTHEYAIKATGLANPTVAQTLSKITTTVTRVNGVYEKEVAVTMKLVSSENNVIFTAAAGDPFTGNNNGSVLLDESQRVIDSAIGTANYDIGHTFSTGGGGVAYVGVICDAALKASGITGSLNPTGDGYDIDLVAHEMGHQFGGNHTFNSTLSNCSGNRNGPTACEPGSATTIMGYAGICAQDDIQPNSDAFFHAISYDEIAGYLQSNGNCKTVVPTGNTLPQIIAMSNNGANIPVSTPFTLSAIATDGDGDALTYSWEEWDLGAAGTWNSGATTTDAPLFKARVPKTSGSRVFPDMAVILAGYPANPPASTGGLKGETLPTVARALKFRLTVRDNRAGGGGVTSGGSGCQTGFSPVYQINVSAAGPFIITAPDGGEVWGTGTTQTVTWNPAGTAAAPINCTSVDIQLSTDGGATYPVTLVAGTPNDGTQQVVIPATATLTARVRIVASGNIFFDISNNNFTIAGPYITKANGNWNNTATWLGGIVPSAGVDVLVHHVVVVTANATCYSLKVEPPAGSLTLNAGLQLVITH